MALFGRDAVVHAQTSGEQTTSNQNLQEIVVTGIRASLEKSLEQKRAADSIEDVITSEDVGKMPDKNIADSLKRVAGVTISSAGATEGGFDENDRVSMRGTGPSLTQTLINGHNVSSGDWFVLNQTNTVGRSVSYTLLPSELVSKVWCTRAPKRHWSRAAWRVRSTSSRANPSTSKSRSPLKVRRRGVRRSALQDRPAAERAG